MGAWIDAAQLSSVSAGAEHLHRQISRTTDRMAGRPSGTAACCPTGPRACWRGLRDWGIEFGVLGALRLELAVPTLSSRIRCELGCREAVAQRQRVQRGVPTIGILLAALLHACTAAAHPRPLRPRTTASRCGCELTLPAMGADRSRAGLRRCVGCRSTSRFGAQRRTPRAWAASVVATCSVPSERAQSQLRRWV
jgi:hypothetical protein